MSPTSAGDGSGARRARGFRVGLLVGFSLLGAGCSMLGPLRPRALVPSYEPSNVYTEEAVFPREIRRVAVLPLLTSDPSGEAAFGRDALEPVLNGELQRSRQFELELVPADRLLRLTGLSRWEAGDRYAEDFFDRLREGLGVQAVLVAELTQYRPYEPLVIGWRLKLIDVAEPRIIWAVDEVFDAREPSVAAAARRFAEGRPDGASGLSDDRAVLQSPRRFGRYTASAVVATLPPRALAVAPLKN